jgi:hypothetical protein
MSLLVQTLPRFEKGMGQVIRAKEEGRGKNFCQVASLTSIKSHFYSSDLLMLMKLCVQNKEIDFALGVVVSISCVSQR